ncbi:MAG: hypothetical protein EBU90_19245 [Proteobacteria bacterium]|nr:hypothetical protein [Pseudomonadota bacterium]NBP14469.1 hypothetical protein [bacterium]
MSVLMSTFEDNNRTAYVYLEKNKYKLVLKENDNIKISYHTYQQQAEDMGEDWVLKANLGD